MTLSYSVIDTFDMWGPSFDRPQSFQAWRRAVSSLAEGRLLHCDSTGQGNVAVIKRIDS